MFVRIFKQGNNWVVQPRENGKTYYMPTLRLALDLAYESIQLPDREHSNFVLCDADSHGWGNPQGSHVSDVDEVDSPWEKEYESPFEDGSQATAAA